MTKRRFAKRSAFAAIMATAFAAPAAPAQQAGPPPKAGRPINAGDVLSGQLMVMRVRAGNDGKRVPTYQITSEPRRLAAAERTVQSRNRAGNVPARHHQRRPGRGTQDFCRQGSVGESRRDRLRAGGRAGERSRGHEMEPGDEALTAGQVVPAKAGTHNHRTLLLRWVRLQSAHNDLPVVWSGLARVRATRWLGRGRTKLNRRRPQRLEMPTPAAARPAG